MKKGKGSEKDETFLNEMTDKEREYVGELVRVCMYV